MPCPIPCLSRTSRTPAVDIRQDPQAPNNAFRLARYISSDGHASMIAGIKTCIANFTLFNLMLRQASKGMGMTHPAAFGASQAILFTLNPLVGSIVSGLIGGDHAPVMIGREGSDVAIHLLNEQYGPLLPGLTGFVFDAVTIYLKASGMENFMTDDSHHALIQREGLRTLLVNGATAFLMGILREHCRQRNGSARINSNIHALTQPPELWRGIKNHISDGGWKSFKFSAIGGVAYGVLSGLTKYFLDPSNISAEDDLKKAQISMAASAAYFGTLVTGWGLQHATRVAANVNNTPLL